VLKGRWAEGIAPRNFAWIVRERLAVSERPGGYARNHRKVRRHEEILWLEAQGFTRVVSLLSSPHNLRAYEELGLPAVHVGLPPKDDVRDVLEMLYPAMLAWLRDGECLLLHQDELSERVAGVAAGFLCWCGLLPDAPRAIYAVEQLVRRQLGSSGRSIVGLVAQLSPPDPVLLVPPVAPDEPVAATGPVARAAPRRAPRPPARGPVLSVVPPDSGSGLPGRRHPEDAPVGQAPPPVRAAAAPGGVPRPRSGRERQRPAGAPERPA
jgi:hypothetical protein